MATLERAQEPEGTRAWPCNRRAKDRQGARRRCRGFKLPSRCAGAMARPIFGQSGFRTIGWGRLPATGARPISPA